VKNKQSVGVRIVKSSADSVAKAAGSTKLNTSEGKGADEWITPPYNMAGLREIVKNSSILPQCISAYKGNIAGFGIGVRYKDDVKETEAMAGEYTRAEKIINLLSIEKDIKEVFEDIIAARETYGIAFVEVIRNLAGEVVQIEFIKDTGSIQQTCPLSPHIEKEFYYAGEVVLRKKKFCKYKQSGDTKTVYFKEFGDPRLMDSTTGEYGKDIPLEKQANEIIAFTIGTEHYGEVRWCGQVLGIDGSRKAEILNNRYFTHGRHTPMMIMIKGGTLTDDSFTKLQDYMDGIQGEAGQHAFIVLEAESVGRTDFEGEPGPDIEIKDLAAILQKDELFQGYLENNRRRTQSAFQLPDLYTGYTTDFNRATAQSAIEVTEKQVFQPARNSLAWIINNKILSEYRFQYVEVYFKAPDISNPDDLARILNITERAGGLTPNKAKEISYELLGDDFEPYKGDWGDTPLAYSRPQQSALSPGVGQQLEKQIQKAAAHNDDAIVAIMKEVRTLLIAKSEEG